MPELAFPFDYVIDGATLVAFAGLLAASVIAGILPVLGGRLGKPNWVAIVAVTILVFFLLSGGVMVWLHYDSIGRELDKKELFLHRVVFTAVLFFALLSGMVFKYFHELEKAGKSFGEAKLQELIAPLAVSLVIFFGAWGAEAERLIGLLPVGLAIQNGFFWQDVLGRLSGGPGASAAPTVPK